MSDRDTKRLLLDTLEQHFQSAEQLEGLGRGPLAALLVDEQLPRRLWEPALLAPVREFLSRPGKEFRARLVETSWNLARTDGREMPASLPMIVELLHAGSLIVDDIQDGSHERRGGPALHHIYGVPLAINAGSWLYFWSFSLLGQLVEELVDAPVQMEIMQRANRAMLYCHQGQAIDLATRVHALSTDELPAAVAMSTGLKTGLLMEFAAFLGARSAGADRIRCAAIGRFGNRVGVGLQMLDDLGGVLTDKRRHKAVEDMLLARLTWPWAWLAQLVEGSGGDGGDARAGECTGTMARWQARARAVAEEGDREGAASLILDMAGVVGDHGRCQVADYLAAAFTDLRTEVGPSSHLQAIEAELKRLERSYG